MANQIIFGATITPANAAMEVSTNGGTSFTALAFTTVGSVQQGTLTGVAAATYAAGQLIMRAVGYPATAQPSTGSVVVAAAAPTMEHFGLVGQSNSLDKSLASDATAAPLSTYTGLSAAQANVLIWSPSAAVYQPVQIGVNDLSASDPTDCGTTGPGGGTAYPPTRGIFAGGLGLRLAALYPGVTFRMVKFSANGQSFTSVLTGGGWKVAHDARYTAAKNKTVADGFTWHLKAVKLQFGEQDQNAGLAYAPLADQYVSEMTANGYAQTNTLWVVIAVKDSSGIDKSAYRAQMLAWVNAAPTYRRYVDSANYQGIVNDDIHLNGVSQMQIGHSDFPNAVFGQSGGFRVVADTAPVMTSISPTSGAVGATVTLTGTGFYPAMTVFFSNNVATTITTRTGTTQVVFTVPAGAVTGPVTAFNGTASAATAAFTVTVVTATVPVFSSFTNNRQPNEAVVLTGSGFASGGAPTVTFGGVSVPVVSYTDTAINLLAPLLANACTITITNTAGSTSNATQFTPAVMRAGQSIADDSALLRYYGTPVWSVGTNPLYSSGHSRFHNPAEAGYMEFYTDALTLAGWLPAFTNLAQKFDYQVDSGAMTTITVPVPAQNVNSAQTWITPTMAAGVKRIRVYSVAAYNLYCIVDKFVAA